ncbi:hypothetical protein [Polaribacter vadi]|uniref:hypothetical protein n=1 Tax=Polaribacter vadi TaxID=1774273 RepID=UPI0030EF869B|tara:strand:- start:26964 stop:27146 length:183 start_codon:yes stop_codon:yes gene_type:complete
MKNIHIVSFEEQSKKAQEILESEVRPQVELYERLKQKNSSPKAVVLSPAQKAYLACTHLL